MHVVFLLVASIFWIDSAVAGSMSEDFLDFKNHPEEIFHGLPIEGVDNYHWVFIGGYGNEMARTQYFRENTQALYRFGATHVSVIFPSSFNSAGENRTHLLKEITPLYSKGYPRPLILIGHSKGGLEALATVVQYPGLINPQGISDIILVQAPVGGNSILDEKSLFGYFLSMSLGFVPGHRSIHTPQIQKLIRKKILSLPEDLFQKLDDAVKFVVSSKDPKSLGPPLAFTHTFANIRSPHDGLVSRRDMSVFDHNFSFGTVLGDLQADHLELFLEKPLLFIPSSQHHTPAAFTRALVIHILRSKQKGVTDYKNLTNQLRDERLERSLCRKAFIVSARQ